MLEKLNFVGWDKVEPQILSAMLAQFPLLMIGNHGTHKTMGAEILAKSVLGKDAKYEAYDTPNLQFDDLVGFINPAQYANAGSVINSADSFIKTPFTIWDKDAVLFDEITLANPFAQGKLNELIRNRTIMGLPTNLKYVFAAANPPGTYDTMHMPLALASRFSIIEAPSLKQMDAACVRQLVNIEFEQRITKPVKPLLKDLFAKASQITITQEDNAKIQQLFFSIYNNFKSSVNKVIIEGRTLTSMYKLLTAFYRLKQSSPELKLDTITHLPDILGSVIPEGFPVINTAVKRVDIDAILRSVVSNFELNGQVHDLVSYLDSVQIADPMLFQTECIQKIMNEVNVRELKKAAKKIPALTIDGSAKQRLLNIVNTQQITLKLKSTAGFSGYDGIKNKAKVKGGTL